MPHFVPPRLTALAFAALLAAGPAAAQYTTPNTTTRTGPVRPAARRRRTASRAPMRLATGFARLPSPASSPVGATWTSMGSAAARTTCTLAMRPKASKTAAIWRSD